MTEFALIQQFFAQHTYSRHDVNQGIGDDAALVKIAEEQQLAITTDTLVADVHFLKTTAAEDIGYKALAVNLSDLAAMGAKPAWVTLALTLPEPNTDWLAAFCRGFFSLADESLVQLIGGDLTRGPLSITIQAMGLLPLGAGLLRSQAKVGDHIYVTGTLGDAGLGLQLLKNKLPLTNADHAYLIHRLNRPTPRLFIGENIRTLANAAIDISDGLAADLKHILQQSNVGAQINIDAIPLSAPLSRACSREEAIALALTAGDDYELCFTIGQDKEKPLQAMAASFACPITRIGTIISPPHLELHDRHGQPYEGPQYGYQHF